MTTHAQRFPSARPPGKYISMYMYIDMYLLGGLTAGERCVCVVIHRPLFEGLCSTMHVHSTFYIHLYTYYMIHTYLHTSSLIQYLTHVSHVSEGRVIVSAHTHALWREWCDSRTREETLIIFASVVFCVKLEAGLFWRKLGFNFLDPSLLRRKLSPENDRHMFRHARLRAFQRCVYRLKRTKIELNP